MQERTTQDATILPEEPLAKLSGKQLPKASKRFNITYFIKFRSISISKRK